MNVHFLYSDYPMILWLTFLFLSVSGSFLFVCTGLTVRRYKKEIYEMLKRPFELLQERRKIFKSTFRLFQYVAASFGVLYGLYYPIGFPIFLGIHIILFGYAPIFISISAVLLQVISWYFMMHVMFFKTIQASLRNRQRSNVSV